MSGSVSMHRDEFDRRCRQLGRAAAAAVKGDGLYEAVVWCGEKSVVDKACSSLSQARLRVRTALEKHGDKVTAWFIYDMAGAVPVRVAGCVEDGEEVQDE